MDAEDVFELESVQGEPKYESPKPKKSAHWSEVLQEELDGYYRIMREFKTGKKSPSDIFLCLSGWTARMSEVKGQLFRENTTLASQLRIREVEPFIMECERQFKYHSRRFSGMEFNAKLDH